MNEIQTAYYKTKFLEPLHFAKHHGKWQLIKKHVEMDGKIKRSETVVYGNGISLSEKLRYAYNMIGLGVLGLVSGTAIGAVISIVNAGR